MSRALLGGVLTLAMAPAAWAGAVIQSMSGDVSVGGSRQALTSARQDQRLAASTTITTGAQSQAVIRFDDGGQMVLDQNTEFRIVDSRYAPNSPQADRAVFDLVRGALRVVSGAIGQRNHQLWALRAPQMTLGLRGTDFMVAMTNQAYVNVSQGAVVVSNGHGSTVLDAGSIAAVPSSAAAVVVIRASSLPTAVSGAFSRMSGAPGVVAGGRTVSRNPSR